MSIGGYFELELPKGEEYHQNAIRLNTGRNAFEYILRAKKYKKVFLPYYTCDVMLEPIKKLQLEFEFYQIDETFRPFFDFSRITVSDVFVYNNYFGICDRQVYEVSKKCKNLIIDNSQAFYSKPFNGVDTFYSPRKFFGLPDGAYLYTNTKLNVELEQDVSFQRCEHLLGRIDTEAEQHYRIFKKNSSALANQSIKTMSNLTMRLLQSIDYKHIAQSRRDNFYFFNAYLGNSNKLNISITEDMVPMIYPYLTSNGSTLKKKLIENKIFVATYWLNVLEYADKESIEYSLVKNLISLPVDRRLNNSHLLKIVKQISNESNSKAT